MYSTMKVRDGLTLVHPLAPIHPLLTEGPLTAAHALTLVREGRTPYELPTADAYVRRLADEAEVWLHHARARARMKEETLVRKALDSLAFSLRHRCNHFAVPSKVSGSSKAQPALWELSRQRVSFGTPLDVEEIREGRRVRLVVSHGGSPLGEVQPKHATWLRPLLPFGAAVYVIGVSGDAERFLLGLSVALVRVGRAAEALRHALGHDTDGVTGGDGYGGERAAQAAVEPAPAMATPLPDLGGDGADGPADGAALDEGPIRLWRDERGLARTNVPHAVYFSPDGFEWGYGGSGPAELALSILCLFLPFEEAHALHGRYKDDVLEKMDWDGGAIEREAVRQWIRRQRDGHERDRKA